MAITEQRFTFDEVAELYDRIRPGYPRELFDAMVSETAVPSGARILEVGCGTGQATVLLAARDFEMLCLEPGESMYQVACRNTTGLDRVEILNQTFEDWSVEESGFDLVVSAQAFHWVDPAIGFPKAARALRAGGALVLIGNVSLPMPSPLATERPQSPVRAAVVRAYEEHAPALAQPSATRWYAADGPIRDLVAASHCFSDVGHYCFPWSQSYSAEDYAALMRTHSDHRLLPEAQCEPLLDAIREAIVDHGGTIEMGYDAHLYVAHL